MSVYVSFTWRVFQKSAAEGEVGADRVELAAKAPPAAIVGADTAVRLFPASLPGQILLEIAVTRQEWGCATDRECIVGRG